MTSFYKRGVLTLKIRKDDLRIVYIILVKEAWCEIYKYTSFSHGLAHLWNVLQRTVVVSTPVVGNHCHRTLGLQLVT